MTLQEFSNARSAKGDRAIYKNIVYFFSQIDFEDCIIGIRKHEKEKEFEWVRCENIEYLPVNALSK